MYARLSVFALTVALGLPGTLYAGPIFDFSTLSVGGKVTDLGTGTTTVGPVTAQGFKLSSGLWVASHLIARNEGGDEMGLGVCSEGATNCNYGGTGAGDYNELSQLSKQEAILLTLAPGWKWSQLWVSSLDSGDSPGLSGTVNGKESGIVNWGSSSGIATLISSGSSFSFAYPDVGTDASGDILGLGAASSFDHSARYVLFRPNGPLGANNDYLVWGAAAVQTVPEPGTLALFALGATVARASRRRRN